MHSCQGIHYHNGQIAIRNTKANIKDKQVYTLLLINSGVTLRGRFSYPSVSPSVRSCCFLQGLCTFYLDWFKYSTVDSHARITWAEDRSIPQVLGELPWSPSMSGLNFSINDTFRHSLHPQGLGKDLVILDVDTRVWTTEDASNMSQLTWGRLNHYLYGSYFSQSCRTPPG